MTAHVTKGPSAEVEALPPLSRVIVTGDKGTLLRYSQPEVPVQLGRHRVGAVGSWPKITPMLAAPAMDLFHPADGVPLDNFHDHPVNLVRMDLDAHLGHQLLLSGRLGELASLVDRLRERLLCVNIEPLLHGAHCDRAMHMIRRRNVHRVEALLFIEQLAPVL